MKNTMKNAGPQGRKVCRKSGPGSYVSLLLFLFPKTQDSVFFPIFILAWAVCDLTIVITGDGHKSSTTLMRGAVGREIPLCVFPVCLIPGYNARYPMPYAPCLI